MCVSKKFPDCVSADTVGPLVYAGHWAMADKTNKAIFSLPPTFSQEL